MVNTAGSRPPIVLVAVLCLVALSGCSGLLGPEGGGDTPTPPSTELRDTADPTSVETPTGTTSSTPTRTATPTPDAVDPDNPFGERTISVAITDPVDGRDYRPMVRRALDYWEDNSTAYAGYPVEFRLVDRSADHRIRVTVTNSSISCNSEVDHRTTGCAPLNEHTAPETSEVKVASGYSDHYTYEIVVHELGHALGIGHGEPPEAYMAPTHPSGLSRDPVHVFVTDESGHVSSREHTEVTMALEYFETHPALDESERLDWVEVDSAARADLIVEGGDGDECFSAGAGSCSADARYGDQQKIVLDNIDPDLYAWHTAALLAPAFLEDDEIPPVLTDDSSRDERRRWSG